MTIVGQFDHLDDNEKINKLKVQIKDLRKVNRSHQKLVGNLYNRDRFIKKRYDFSQRRGSDSKYRIKIER